MAVSNQPVEIINPTHKSVVSPFSSNEQSTTESENYQLLSLLQSTIDLKPLLNCFLDNLRERVPVDGIRYTEDSRQLKIKLGKQSTHRCGYNLSNGNICSGEIVFQRSSRFLETELEFIERAIVLLLMPLSNALRYQDAVANAAEKPRKNIAEAEFLRKTLSREIELAKRHNNPLTILCVRLHAQDRKKLAQNIDGLGAELFKHLSLTDLVFKTAVAEYLIVTHSEFEPATEMADKLRNHLTSFHSSDLNSTEQFQLTAGVASLTGTDSFDSLWGRARKTAS